MKKAMKRAGSLLLAICMLITMLPVTAYAAGDEGSEALPVVNVNSEWELINALQSTTSSAIKLTGSIELKSEVTMGAGHTLVIPEGEKLDIIDVGHHDIGEIEVNGKTLTINGGGIVNIEKSDFDGDGISDFSNYLDGETVGTLMLENITVNIENISSYGGLAYLNITVGDGAVINLNSPASYSQIHISHGYTLSINDGGEVNVNNFYDYGITNYGSILINGGELNISEGTGDNEGIYNYSSYDENSSLELRSGTLNADEGSGIYFDEYTIVKGMEGKLSDRGTVLTSDDVTVGFRYDEISENGLTAGLYVLNGNVFSKEGINITDRSPRNITITEGSACELHVEAAATNGKPVAYQWYEYKEVWYEEYDEWDYLPVKIEGETDSTLTISNSLAVGEYEFCCKLRVIPEGHYGMTVGGVEVTEANHKNITGGTIRGKVSYDPIKDILTLDNAKIAVIDNPTDEDYIFAAVDVYGGIENLTIELKGSSQIGNKPAAQGEDTYYNVLYGIISYNKITVKGSGSLTIYDYTQGISAKDITIDTTGTITIKEHGGHEACCLKASGGTLEIISGNLILSSIVSNGLYGDTIKISGGTVTAESFDELDADNYAFNKAPAFASGYNYKVYAGDSKASAKEVTSPAAATFTASKYVKIVPVTSGGKDDDNNNSDGNGGKDKDTSPAAPTVPAPPAETSKKPVEQMLNDVGTHWALNSIQFVYDRGIMTGTSGEQFSPDARMNRGMLITALGRLAGINSLDFTSGSFNDVDISSYYGPYAEWSLRNNITRGTGSNNFSPDNPVMREELAVILVNFAKAMGYYLPSGEGAQSFADGSTISPWAMEAIEIMRNANIMQGDPGNNFNPKAPATRAEIAAVLQRFIEYMGL